MERGLLWLPLLGVFGWLGWAGWHEYRKLEAYKLWAADFEWAKYDIYAVLGLSAERLVWGRPTRHGPVQLQSVTLVAVKTVSLSDTRPSAPNQLDVPKGCHIYLTLTLDSGELRCIPFTDLTLAEQWQVRLQSCLQSLQSASTQSPSTL